MSDLDTLLQMDTQALVEQASALRDRGHRDVVTYSRKVFIPLTQLCRDVCHYCTFAKAPKRLAQPYLTREQVLDIARQGKALGCKEALFTLGDKPELRYRAARLALAELGYTSTLDYLKEVATAVLEETGLLPHLNPGVLTADEYRMLRPVAPSMGLMLESSSKRLCERGGPHFGSPDKDPDLRLASIRAAGEAKVPLTSGILIGIGETRRERLESLQSLRQLHDEYGHLQEIIVQNFVPKPGTKMHAAAPAAFEELAWTTAAARLIFGPAMSIQVPPNLNPGYLHQLVMAGINDWGGVSPLTPDHVNPESPWPQLGQLAEQTSAAGKHLAERLTVYPAHIDARQDWIDPSLYRHVLELADADGLARSAEEDAGWTATCGNAMPREPGLNPSALRNTGTPLGRILSRAADGGALEQAEILRLYQARGDEIDQVRDTADQLRQQVCGDAVTYVVTRNINYTNICQYKCTFCAFAKGKAHEDLRGQPYLTDLNEISRRVEEAWQRGATEVCLQGGIHPSFTGQTYLDICAAAREAAPGIHIHAFSPLEITQGARTLGLGTEDYLRRLQEAGLNTLPGTAAEILDDRVRALICPDKITVAEWLDVVSTAHRLGLRSTATILFGHLESSRHWAGHLHAIRRLQDTTGGFTEFVPLPFVHMEAPMYRRGLARPGPTAREVVLMHAVARVALHTAIDNIQASWPKLGPEFAAQMLDAGVNDLGGTLMNESISRAAGAGYGQELPPRRMAELIRSAGRTPRQRTTLYAEADYGRQLAAASPEPLSPVINRDLRNSRRQGTAG